MKRIFALITIIIFSANLFTGCKKDKGNPPTLPSSGSMAIDFSNFSSGTKSDGTDLPKGVNAIDWNYAALMAGYWKTIITGTLAVPVAVFKLAADRTPSYVSTKKWQWTISGTVSSVSYTAKLTGEIKTTDVLWNMYITKSGTGGFTDFLWFTGTSKIDGTGGQWILYDSPTYNEPILQIDWTGSGTAVTDVKYTYVRTLNDARTTDTFNGSYIEYGSTTGTYNYFYTIHFYYLTEFYDANVEWNSTGIIGRVKCLKFFGDSLWHCWDASHVDATCPSK
ncbi:MAG: hypothetical protein ABSA76_12030 [Bacteroidales bacterium]